ncbi:chaperonin family protein RbcX [Crocosphaera watsonii WH 8501]|uniref:RuBisCO chaperone RbcX n=4 Tax=Crocosphaera watsonii TaxID=263511 RepID=Q4C1R0_CROWT|nr:MULTISPECIES: chaperonin family protein RbcX [Crocosphaera]EAM50082.1 Chaperonin-like RbcX [Crocosphaera watsonii WH 8501]EHJ11912.1 putative RuBisCo chaperonin RbcX [Crocosphaera watsonii WH 0003]MCH2243060.1 chaperonin family protein RbcX [Crocosphaera sp.]CCQ56784.1 Possible RuBisCo chaperonin RbcX [Crocosphaera watsonii WH 0005]CCQ65019.1 Possible RuBisCo chaperonin RbcX [Crocosphaera watsonii WH 0402]
MYPKKIANETAEVIQNYLTYQAVRLIIDQLSETNPKKGIWLRQYASSQNIQKGEAFIEGLMAEDKELVLRILKVREYLASEVMEFMPQMVRHNINQANVEHRRQLLERLTGSPSMSSTASESENDDSKPNSD